MKFQKGHSGNPGGRPKVVAEVQTLAREHSAVAIQTLVSIMRDPKSASAARVAAANAILDRGYGRPAQTMTANVNPLDRLSSDQRTALEAALAELEGESDEATEH